MTDVYHTPELLPQLLEVVGDVGHVAQHEPPQQVVHHHPDGIDGARVRYRKEKCSLLNDLDVIIFQISQKSIVLFEWMEYIKGNKEINSNSRDYSFLNKLSMLVSALVLLIFNEQ